MCLWFWVFCGSVLLFAYFLLLICFLPSFSFIRKKNLLILKKEQRFLTSLKDRAEKIQCFTFFTAQKLQISLFITRLLQTRYSSLCMISPALKVPQSPCKTSLAIKVLKFLIVWPLLQSCYRASRFHLVWPLLLSHVRYWLRTSSAVSSRGKKPQQSMSGVWSPSVHRDKWWNDKCHSKAVSERVLEETYKI